MRTFKITYTIFGDTQLFKYTTAQTGYSLLQAIETFVNNQHYRGIEVDIDSAITIEDTEEE